MLIPGSPYRRQLRLVASLLLMVFSTALLFPFPVVGGLAMAFFAGSAIYQGVQIRRERPDPYDLSRLWEESPPPPEEPEEDDRERDLIYCHRCGASMPAKYAICPQCGIPLGP